MNINQISMDLLVTIHQISSCYNINHHLVHLYIMITIINVHHKIHEIAMDLSVSILNHGIMILFVPKLSEIQVDLLVLIQIIDINHSLRM